MSAVYNRLKKVCGSGSSIGISSQSWKELERLWALLENLVTDYDLKILLIDLVLNKID